MVKVALDQRLGPVHMCFLEGQVFTHNMVGIAVSVRLMIGLVHYEYAPSVAEFIEVFAVGVVAGTQEVDVSLLHQSNVLLIGGIVYITARTWMMIVTVHATKFDVFSVNLEYFPHDLHFLHAEVIVEVLDDAVVLVPQFDAERIEVGLLCRPEFRRVHRILYFNGCGVASANFLHALYPFVTFNLPHNSQVLPSLLADVAKADIGLYLSL